MRLFNILVGVIPFYAGKVLIIRRGPTNDFLPGVWGVPGGKVEFGEQVEAAALRELKEETGLVGKVGKLVGYSTFMSEQDGCQYHNLQLNFIVELFSAEPVFLEEGYVAYKWVKIKDCESENLDSFTCLILRQAVNEVHAFK